jgi:predicted outer membrane lipoprotein
VTSTRSKWALRLSVLYFALSAAALVWPIYPWLGNHIEPRVFGLPFSLVWVLGVIACNFGVLTLLYRLGLIDAADEEAGAAS